MNDGFAGFTGGDGFSGWSQRYCVCATDGEENCSAVVCVGAFRALTFDVLGSGL